MANPSPLITPVGSEMPSARAPRRSELVSTGIDEALQTLGGDPFGGISTVGLRIPAFVPGIDNRYLFFLCGFTLADGETARIVGVRQGLWLGLRQAGAPPRTIEQEVTNPAFKLPNGNVSWHITTALRDEPRVPNPGEIQDPLAGGLISNLAFKNSDTPALLFNTVATPTAFYTDLTAYTPPNAGRPWGRPIAAEFGTFFDLKCPWRDASDWRAVDLPIAGPCRVGFYASVLQSDPNGRAVVTPPATFFPMGLSPEEQFLLNFPTAIYWRIAGALCVEFEDGKMYRSGLDRGWLLP